MKERDIGQEEGKRKKHRPGRRKEKETLARNNERERNIGPLPELAAMKKLERNSANVMNESM